MHYKFLSESAHYQPNMQHAAQFSPQNTMQVHWSIYAAKNCCKHRLRDPNGTRVLISTHSRQQNTFSVHTMPSIRPQHHSKTFQSNMLAAHENKIKFAGAQDCSPCQAEGTKMALTLPSSKDAHHWVLQTGHDAVYTDLTHQSCGSS